MPGCGVGRPARALYNAAMRALDFVKMHGLGNDFVILDARDHVLTLDTGAARAICDRHRGVGCDQILIIEPAKNAGTAFMRIRNADGSEAEACGNGARCVAWLLMGQNKTDRVVLETLGGPISAERAGDHRIAVDMGEPRLGWREIPLAKDCDTLHVPLSLGPLSDPVCTSMGNPHATFFVPDLARDRYRDARPDAGARSDVPGACQYRRRANRFARTHSRARLGTRRWANPRLRQRRLRDLGRSGAARPDRAPAPRSSPMAARSRSSGGKTITSS